jgi:hypothetical protein
MSAITALVLVMVTVLGQHAIGLAASVAEIAMYRGKDREQKLIEGAKKEGQVMFYNSNTWLEIVAQEFEKKYPFIKVGVWRSEGRDVIKRVLEEYASGRYIADVVETTPGSNLSEARILTGTYSPEISAYGDDVRKKGKMEEALGPTENSISGSDLTPRPSPLTTLRRITRGYSIPSGRVK